MYSSPTRLETSMGTGKTPGGVTETPAHESTPTSMHFHSPSAFWVDGLTASTLFIISREHKKDAVALGSPTGRSLSRRGRDRSLSDDFIVEKGASTGGAPIGLVDKILPL